MAGFTSNPGCNYFPVWLYAIGCKNQETMPLTEAVTQAVNDCIKETSNLGFSAYFLPLTPTAWGFPVLYSLPRPLHYAT